VTFITWISACTGAKVDSVDRRPGGGRHQAFDVTLTDPDGSTRHLFLRADAGAPADYEHYTLRREAEIYRALLPTAVPVPALLALHPDLPAVLMEYASGTARFAGLDPETQRHITDHFVTILAALHDLDVTKLDLPTLLPARSIRAHVLDEIDSWESRLDGSSEPQPFLRACFAWLRANVPDPDGPPSLVQGDTGPGNFLHDGDSVTAVLDWELAHLGDPLEDLAWVATRNAQEPLPDFDAFVRAYEDRRGKVDGGRIRYHMVFAELRIAVLAARREGGERDPLGEVGNGLIYGALHKRLTVEALAAATGVGLPPMELPEAPESEFGELYDAALAQLREIIVPAVTDPFASARAKSLARILKRLRGADRYGEVHRAREQAELTELLGHPVDSIWAGRHEAESLVRTGALDAVALLPLAWQDVRREHQAMGSAMGVLARRHLPGLQAPDRTG
jgi:aminoglycoside phosphotransferase (APT) family kinase protein